MSDENSHRFHDFRPFLHSSLRMAPQQPERRLRYALHVDRSPRSIFAVESLPTATSRAGQLLATLIVEG